MATCRYDKHQGSDLVAKGRGLGNVLHEIHADNERIYIHDRGSTRCNSHMIGSLVLRTARAPLRDGLIPKLSIVKAVLYPDEM